MTHQKRHLRTSKRGKRFVAGKRKTKRCYLCKQPTPLDEGRVVPVDEIWNKQFCCDNCIDIGHGGKFQDDYGVIKTKNLDGSYTEIGMDTHNEKEGLHIWVGDWEKRKVKKGRKMEEEDFFDDKSIHLTREQARKLRDQINKRLFD
jgi:hypothetical protein